MDPAHLRGRLDPEVVDQWERDLWQTGRLEGCGDPVRRLEEVTRDGIVAEVLFPDFGMPFEAFGPPSQTMRQGSSKEKFTGWPVRTQEQIDEGNKAHNRWLVDFVSTAPERFCAMGVASFHDVDNAMNEIRWAREHGLKGLLLPTFSTEMPLFHERHEPIWSLLEELDMPVNSHVAISSTQPRAPFQGIPDPRVAVPLCSKDMMAKCHDVLVHFIWSGILERHPNLKVAFTEQGSGWIIHMLESLDYSWDRSYLRSDSHDVVPRPPSEYFRRQCWLGIVALLSRRDRRASRDRARPDAARHGLPAP